MQDDNNPAASTAQDIKAAARDMLRMGSRWANSALDWIDERRHEMNHRNRDDRDFGSERERDQSPYSASAQGWQERERYGQPDRHQGSRREQLQGRSDRDIQGDYSGGGYDQVGGRDWSRDRESERHAWSREGRYSQSRARSLDDDSLRGDYASDTGLGYGGAGYGYGASGPGGVGYGAPGYGAGAGYGEPRYHGDFQSRAVGEQEGYGSTGREFGGRGFESEYGRGYGSQGAYAQGGRAQEGYAPSWRGERGYGSAGQGLGRSGESQRYERGLASQHHGAERYDESGYGRQGERNWQAGQRDEGMPRSRYGAQGDQPWSQAGQAGRSYRGIGPRNYTRSDERIREDLNERLTDAHDIDASQVTVEVNNGVATLTGTVNERWMKHRAEDIADGCSGVRDVRNNLQVESRAGESGRRQDTYGSASGQYASTRQQGASSQHVSSGQQSTSGQSGSSTSASLGASGSSSTSGSSVSSPGSTPQGSSTGRGTSGGGTGPNV